MEPLLQERRTQPREKRKRLQGRRGAGRGGTRNCRGYPNNQRSDFETVHDRHEGKIGRLRGHDRARCRTNRANVRGGRRGRPVGAKVELRPQEDDPEEQRQNADAARLGLHVLTKTELRQEWLRGQENDLLPGVPVCNQSGLSDVKSAKVKCR